MFRSLEWGSHQHIQDLICEQVETSGSSGFDYILGSDLYYNRSQDSVVSDIFRTVSALLSKEEHASFFMAGTRRDLNIEKIFSIAHEAGFVWTLEPGYVFDIFDNSTDEMTDLWRDA